MINAVPKHIAIIMDGNGRYAEKKKLPKKMGHKAGADALKRVAEYAGKIGVNYMTVYAFSTENWNRPADEVNYLMRLLEDYIDQYVADSKKNDMRFIVIGDRAKLSAVLQQKISRLMDITKDKVGLTLVFAINYGGRDEMPRAVRKAAAAAKSGKLDPATIDESFVSGLLDTAGIPAPELCIRTSGEMRLSNFLLWQVAYSELVFTDTLWPEFSEKDLDMAIAEFAGRQRRFGGR